MPADPNMGGDPNAMMGDPNAMGGADMNGDGMPDDPNAMDAAAMDTPAEGGDDIQGIYDDLNDDHKKAVKKYAQSMEDLEGEDTAEGGEMSADPNMAGDPNAMASAPMQESFIFTKAQLKKINEEFGVENMDTKNDDKKPLKDKKDNGINKKSPFDAPEFN